MDHEGIWGVSVVRENADGSTKRMTNISRLFRSKVTAKAYIDRLHRYLEEFGWPEGKFEPETTGE